MARVNRRDASGSAALAAALLAILTLPGCSMLPRGTWFEGSRAMDDAELYLTAQEERTAALERQVARLRADLEQAEEAMVAIESGLRGEHSRADAVSSIADARIAVARVARSVPWRQAEVREAQAKVEEAERQLQAGHTGSAVFFASRASRIADTLDEESIQVARAENARFVDARTVNVRSGPSTDYRVIDTLDQATPVFPEREHGEWVLVRTLSGSVGWVHTSLLRAR